MAAGYSGTPQARKLGLKPGQRVALDHPPARWRLTEPPPELTPVEAREPADVVISFFGAARELPDLSQAWAWAHAQVSCATAGDIASTLGTRPDAVSDYLLESRPQPDARMRAHASTPPIVPPAIRPAAPAWPTPFRRWPDTSPIC